VTAGIPLANPDAKARRSRPYRLAGPSWVIPVLLFLGFFFVIPLGANILRSLQGGQTATNGPLFYYIKLLTDAYYGGVILETLKVAAISTVLCLIVGYPVAYFMVRFAGRWNAIIVFLLIPGPGNLALIPSARATDRSSHSTTPTAIRGWSRRSRRGSPGGSTPLARRSRPRRIWSARFGAPRPPTASTRSAPGETRTGPPGTPRTSRPSRPGRTCPREH